MKNIFKTAVLVGNAILVWEIIKLVSIYRSDPYLAISIALLLLIPLINLFVIARNRNDNEKFERAVLIADLTFFLIVVSALTLIWKLSISDSIIRENFKNLFDTHVLALASLGVVSLLNLSASIVFPQESKKRNWILFICAIAGLVYIAFITVKLQIVFDPHTYLPYSNKNYIGAEYVFSGLVVSDQTGSYKPTSPPSRQYKVYVQKSGVFRGTQPLPGKTSNDAVIISQANPTDDSRLDTSTFCYYYFYAKYDEEKQWYTVVEPDGSEFAGCGIE